MSREISREKVTLVVMTSCATPTVDSRKTQVRTPVPRGKQAWRPVLRRRLLLLGLEQLTETHVGRDHDVVEADHHLFPALFAPADFGFRVGIRGIVGRIVEPPGNLDLAARRK